MLANRVLLSGLLACVLVAAACQTHAAPADLTNFGAISLNPSLAANITIKKDSKSGELTFSMVWLPNRVGSFPETPLDQTTVMNVVTWLRSNWLEFPGQPNSSIQEIFVNPTVYSQNNIVHCETDTQGGQPVFDPVDSYANPIGAVTPVSAARICPPMSFGTFSARMAAFAQITLEDYDGKQNFTVYFKL